MEMILAKVLLAPACVVAVSLAGRRWGVAVAGILAGLPVVAAPILLVLTLQHGDRFGAEAAAGALLGLFALTLFILVYGWLCGRSGPPLTVLAGWAAFLLGIAALGPLEISPLAALTLVVAGFVIGLLILPRPLGAATVSAAPPWWDLPARGLAAMALVIAISTASEALGPGVSGLLTPFPIVTSILAGFTHAHGGRGPTIVLLRSFLIGFYAFATFCFVLATTLDTIAAPAAFALATLAAVLLQTVVLLTRARLLRTRRPAGGPRPGLPSALAPATAPGGEIGGAIPDAEDRALDDAALGFLLPRQSRQSEPRDEQL